MKALAITLVSPLVLAAVFGCESRSGEDSKEQGQSGAVFASPETEGFAGAVSEVDASRVDTSAWLDRLPVIRRFRQVLGG